MDTKHRETLDRWVVHGNTLVGYIFDSKRHPNGTRVQTDAIRYVDPINGIAEDVDTRYKLGTPGTAAEHDQPLIGKPKDSADLILPFSDAGFINPQGWGMKNFSTAEWLGLAFSILTCSIGVTAYAYTNFVLKEVYKDDKAEIIKRLDRIEAKVDQLREGR